MKIMFDTISPQHVDGVALLILDGAKETWKTAAAYLIRRSGELVLKGRLLGV